MPARKKRGFGQLRRLPSKRWQAFYTGPDSNLHYAPTTFETAEDAEAWLAAERRLTTGDQWSTPRERMSTQRQREATTLAAYVERWMKHRDLKPRTREHYLQLLDRHILPALGALPLRALTSEVVGNWYAELDPQKPTIRSHAYGLLRTILGSAVLDEKIAANPVHIRGAGNAKRATRTEPATLDQLATLVDAMPERYKVMTLLAAWCGLRFGELTELRRKDIDLTNGVIKVRRAVTRVRGQFVVGTPKSAAGIRDVAIPPHLVPAVREHLAANMTGRDGLLFPSAGDPAKHLAPASLYGAFYRAREAADRPDLRWHDLRHTGAVLAAQTGATLAELMGRLGHSTPAAAMRYQHAAKGRDAQIAAALSAMAQGNPG
ncbi:tyrosine-type recombinase/integrase [Serinicoccus kebangsaanensis]|uniref:tyrosine-type recombinase/integrase n=1 Tax=Serinicoccus kebangsaanensis TaxID=2602069 RepID=UPI00124E51F7|nr:site-specific integrase [Serinicoccus kebangsaanensis]